ncbi:MAG TPA: FAD-dependent oxidoreductase [Xanthobacteraceae bacterium]|nr:FAD-dependent oxidoreductase [Xanthobacteraceae bacterium]
MTAEVDVAVVGAGAAGLAAGSRLQAAGVRVAVLEAAARAGGRAYTDTTSFQGVAWDRGCHWLHSASVNPLRAAADRLGIAYKTRGSRQARMTHLGRRWASEDERVTAWQALEAAFDAMRQAGAEGRDVAASAVIDTGSPWARLVRHWLALVSAAEPEALSTLDFAAYTDTGENYPVGPGYGALVLAEATDAAPGLSVTLNCPVARIDWSGSGVVLDTAHGRLKARLAVVAVPTTVIAEGGLGFFPALPAELGEAFAAMPLGCAEKVAIRFDRDVFGLPPTSYADTIDLDRERRAPINFTLNPFGHDMAIGQLAGENARGLVAAGPAAMTDFALAALTDAFGSDLRARVIGTATTGWVADPLIGGAYSCALPGAGHFRARLGATLGERVLFAGEAVSPHAYSTCHGAHLTGLEAARTALAALGVRAP